MNYQLAYLANTHPTGKLLRRHKSTCRNERRGPVLSQHGGANGQNNQPLAGQRAHTHEPCIPHFQA